MPFISVDDGTRSWTFAGAPVLRDVLLGDRVHVTFSPRSNELTAIEVTPAAADDRYRAAARAG